MISRYDSSGAARHFTHMSLQFNFYFTESSSRPLILHFSFYRVVQLTLRLRHIFDTQSYWPLKKWGRNDHPRTSLFNATTNHEQVYSDMFPSFRISCQHSCTDRYGTRQYSRYNQPHKNWKAVIFKNSVKQAFRSFDTNTNSTICPLIQPLLPIAQ